MTIKCPHCGSENTKVRRYRTLADGSKKPRYECRDCRKTFVETPESTVTGTTYQQTDEYINVICAAKRIKTKDEIIAEFGIDTNIWKLDFIEVKTSEGYRKDRQVEWQVTNGTVTHGNVKDTGKMLVVPLYHTRAKFVRKDADDLSYEDIDRFFKSYKAPRPKVTVKKTKRNGRILEIILADMHIGNTTFDVAGRCEYVIDDILAEVQGMEFEKILLVLLGDTLHYDTFNRTTTGGTQLDYGMSPYAMFDMGGAVLIPVIDRLAQVAPVELVAIYGNHDRLLSYALFKGLSWYYRNVSNVTVDTERQSTKYRHFGNCLILWDHGDMPKKNLSDLIYNTARREFGQSKYAEIHSGHIHTQKVDEGGGVILRRLPTITNSDEWHVLNGYVGSLRATMAFVWDKERGWKHQLSSNL